MALLLITNQKIGKKFHEILRTMRKKIFVLGVMAITVLSSAILINNNKVIPFPEDVLVKTLEGTEVDLSKEIKNTDHVTVLTFWTTWSSPDKREINTLKEEGYIEAWKGKGVDFIAISIDDVRNKHRVKPYAKSKGWEFTVYHDQNSKAFEQLGGTKNPYTLVVNSSGEVVFTQTGYAPGEEERIDSAVAANIVGK